jgi:hypothetical protein
MWGNLLLGFVLVILGLRWWPLSLLGVAIVVLAWRRFGERGRSDPLPWRQGYLGEERVAAELAGMLPDGFRSLHDVESSGGGNIDHVVVGPTGVFAIETKHWQGRFSTRGGHLMFRGRQADDVTRQATRAAMELKRRLHGAGIWGRVTAIVVSTKAEVRGGRLPHAVAAILRAGAPVTVRSLSHDSTPGEETGPVAFP